VESAENTAVGKPLLTLALAVQRVVNLSTTKKQSVGGKKMEIQNEQGGRGRQ
jgi:hypothetical protein